jgi:ribosome-binding factor A
MREKDIISIRPLLNLPSVEDTTPIELFQNQTLRPILKLQHEIINVQFKYHIRQRNTPFETLPNASREKAIVLILQKELALRNQLFGMVIGLFTRSELHFYLENEPELSKRMKDLLTQRIASEYSK